MPLGGGGGGMRSGSMKHAMALLHRDCVPCEVTFKWDFLCNPRNSSCDAMPGGAVSGVVLVFSTPENESAMTGGRRANFFYWVGSAWPT